MDNTLLATYKGAVLYAEKITGKKLHMLKPEELETDSTIQWLRSAGLEEDEAIDTRIKLFNSVEYWENIPFEKDALSVFKYLYDNHEVYISTSAFLSDSEACYVGKVRWVKKNLPFFNLRRLIYTHAKYNLVGDYIIEDIPSQTVMFKGTPIIFDRPYNRSFPSRLNYRVNSWKEIFTLFTEELKERSIDFYVLKRDKEGKIVYSWTREKNVEEYLLLEDEVIEAYMRTWAYECPDYNPSEGFSYGWR